MLACGLESLGRSGVNSSVLARMRTLDLRHLARAVSLADVFIEPEHNCTVSTEIQNGPEYQYTPITNSQIRHFITGKVAMAQCDWLAS